MQSAFETYIRQHATLTVAELDLVLQAADSMHVPKGDYVLRQGQVCRHKIFIAKGLLRMFGTAADGSEHVLQFTTENGWTLDVESYDKQTPAQYSIAAVEATELLRWPKPAFDRLLAEIPALRAFAQQLVSRNIYNSPHRLLSALSATPEEKYSDFLRKSPDLLARLPLHMVASYLGMSLKTLTRIRHAQAQKTA